MPDPDRADGRFLDRFAWHPEPELIGVREPEASRNALRAAGAAAWETALDYLYDQALERAMGEPADYDGLRALYFPLAGVMNSFYYLKYGLSLVLVFIGLKMLIVEFYHIPIVVSLIVVSGILAIAVVASVVRNRAKTETQ